MTRTGLPALLFSFVLGCGPGGAKDYNEGVRLIRGTSVNQPAKNDHVLVTAGIGVPTSAMILGKLD